MIVVEKTRLANAVLDLGKCIVGSELLMGIEFDLVVAAAVVGDNVAPFLVQAALRVAVAAAHTARCCRTLGRHTWPSCRRNRATRTTLETNTAPPLHHHHQKKRPLDLTTSSMRTRMMMMMMMTMTMMMMKQDPDRD